jgi:hypothetical protein
MEEIIRKIFDYDSFAATESLESNQDRMSVAKQYSEVVDQLYKKRDIPNMMMIGRAALHYCLREAKQLGSSDPDLAKKLKKTAKALAYNLGANVWPGWDEPELTITYSDLVAGLDAARVNLRLTEELKGVPEFIGTAYWLIAALHLAMGQRSDALRMFSRSAEEYRKAAKREAELMAKGYAAIAATLEPRALGAKESQLETVIHDLQSTNSKEAEFFVQQLRTAVRVLLRAQKTQK